jgi:hypothetical protein
LFRDDEKDVRTTGLAGARQDRKARQGKARATIGKELSIGNFTQLDYGFLHSPSLFTIFLPYE